MFKPIFEFLIEPLGLPIEWYYEYIILAVIGVIAYIIAYRTVGDMYDVGFIESRISGSFFHWLIRFIIFAALWAITYGVIWIGKLIANNWSIVLIIVCSIVGILVLWAFTMFIIRKTKAVKNDA